MNDLKIDLTFLNEISPLYIGLFFILIGIVMLVWEKKDNYQMIKRWMTNHYLFQMILSFIIGIIFIIKWVLDLK